MDGVAAEAVGSIAEGTAAVAGSIAGRRPFTGHNGVPQETNPSLAILPAALAEGTGNSPFAAIVKTRDELQRWLEVHHPGLQWLQVEGLLSDRDAWAPPAHCASLIPIDVVLSDPSSEFSDLYRLVDVCAVRDVRVSMPAAPGFLKAIKLAASLRLPIRILPGQPNPEQLAELAEALEFYLHEPMVEAPVEFFHSLLGSFCGADTDSLWMILEEDPAVFLRYDDQGIPKLPRSPSTPSEQMSIAGFVERHFKSLIECGAECATCPWRQECRGYFKWPDPAYSCGGVKQLFSIIAAAANEMGRELAEGPNKTPV